MLQGTKLCLNKASPPGNVYLETRDAYEELLNYMLAFDNGRGISGKIKPCVPAIDLWRINAASRNLSAGLWNEGNSFVEPGLHIHEDVD